MRRFILVILFLMLACFAYAQQTDQDFYLYKIDPEQDEIVPPESDYTLFYRLGQRQDDLYTEITDYRFSFAGMARRGYAFYERGAWLDGITMQRGEVPILRRLAFDRSVSGGITPNHNFSSLAAGSDNFSMMQRVPPQAVNVGTFFSGRGYLGGVRATLHSIMPHDWNLSLYAMARGGNDLYADGVFNNSVDVALRFGKYFYNDAMLSILLLARIGERGLRSGSVQEAFTLIGNNLYNPNWGYQSNQIRNSRTRRDCLPFAMASFACNVGPTTRMTLSVGGRYGEQSYSTLGWYGAMTPRPDNYRFLPSYYLDEQVASVVAQEWRERNERYTQVDWDELYFQNRMSSDGAAYAVEDRVERLAETEFSLRFKREAIGLSISYGLRGAYRSSRNFKRMNDLLGAAYLDDIDYYLLDDDTFSRNLQNNLREPNKRVREGDIFSYDYSLVEMMLAAEAAIEYRVKHWTINAQLQAGEQLMYRRGFYEKEIYAGNESYGRSRRENFAPYVFKAVVWYNFSLLHMVNVGVMAAKRSPKVRDIFLNPEYNNRIVDNPQAESHFASELNYKYGFDKGSLNFSAYVVSTQNQSQTMRAYDDLSAEFCDVVISDLATLRYGAELSTEIKFTKHLTASLAASAARYRYANNPVLTHYADVDNTVVCSSSESYVKDCRLGGAPQFSGVVSLDYITYRGWAASCSLQAVADRYVDVSFIRRTERVARQASASEEIYRDFMHQQRLADAATVDISLSRWFNIRRSRLSFTLSVRNLLGRDDIVYGGYEQSRIRNYMSGSQRVYAPQENVITYSYPRTWYGVVSWKF